MLIFEQIEWNRWKLGGERNGKIRRLPFGRLALVRIVLVLIKIFHWHSKWISGWFMCRSLNEKHVEIIIIPLWILIGEEMESSREGEEAGLGAPTGEWHRFNGSLGRLTCSKKLPAHTFNCYWIWDRIMTQPLLSASISFSQHECPLRVPESSICYTLSASSVCAASDSHISVYGFPVLDHTSTRKLFKMCRPRWGAMRISTVGFGSCKIKP